MNELIEIRVEETVVIERPTGELEIIEVAVQGPPGPAGTDNFDADLALIYQTAKL